MPDHDNKHDKSVDEMLAAFADQVLESQSPADIPLSEDPEIKALQETILHLSEHIPAAASQKSAQEIKENVFQVWDEQYGSKPSWVEKLTQSQKPTQKKSYQSTARRRQITAMRIGSAAVLIIILALILLPGVDLTGRSTSGAAGGQFNPWVLVGGLLLIGGVGLWWWLDSRRK